MMSLVVPSQVRIHDRGDLPLLEGLGAFPQRRFDTGAHRPLEEGGDPDSLGHQGPRFDQVASPQEVRLQTRVAQLVDRRPIGLSQQIVPTNRIYCNFDDEKPARASRSRPCRREEFQPRCLR